MDVATDLCLANEPWHVDPSPVNPVSHSQLYEPSTFEHLAFLSHGLGTAEHSSISGDESIDQLCSLRTILIGYE